MTDFQNILLEMDGAVATITVNRPSKLNALNSATIDELAQATATVRDDRDIRAMILRGAGDKAFVAGADITEFHQLSATGAADFSRRGSQMMRAIEQLGKPSIAAVHGFALGGGCELALACTFRIASLAAKLGLPEITLGVMPGFGGTQRLARIAGRQVALQMATSGKPIGADTARQWGIVDRVVADDELGDAARQFADELASKAPIALGHILKAIDDGLDMDLDQALEMESQLFGLTCATDDMREGTAAFLEKRPASFTGK